MKKVVLGILVCGIIGLVAGNAYADWRSYVWTYEYMTMPKGSWELEYYLTTKVPNITEPDVNTMKHYAELEYGITNRLDIAMYQRVLQRNNKSGSPEIDYDGFKLRARYRIGEKGQFIVDPLLYVEYIRDDDFSNPNVFGLVRWAISPSARTSLGISARRGQKDAAVFTFTCFSSLSRS